MWDKGHYFQVTVEYAKATQDDILCRITVRNMSADRTQDVHVLPHAWFRNTWSWGYEGAERTQFGRVGHGHAHAKHRHIGECNVYVAVHGGGGGGGGGGGDGGDGDWRALPLLFTENETNVRRAFGEDGGGRFTKDAFHRLVVDGEGDAVNPEGVGSKCAGHATARLGPGERAEVWMRLTPE